MGGVILFEKLGVLSAGQTQYGLSKAWYGNYNNQVTELGGSSGSLEINEIFKYENDSALDEGTYNIGTLKINKLYSILAFDVEIANCHFSSPNNVVPNIFLGSNSTIPGTNYKAFGRAKYINSNPSELITVYSGNSYQTHSFYIKTSSIFSYGVYTGNDYGNNDFMTYDDVIGGSICKIYKSTNISLNMQIINMSPENLTIRILGINL